MSETINMTLDLKPESAHDFVWHRDKLKASGPQPLKRESTEELCTFM